MQAGDLERHQAALEVEPTHLYNQTQHIRGAGGSFLECLVKARAQRTNDVGVAPRDNGPQTMGTNVGPTFMTATVCCQPVLPVTHRSEA